MKAGRIVCIELKILARSTQDGVLGLCMYCMQMLTNTLENGMVARAWQEMNRWTTFMLK